jgi:tRNA(Ile)-lysidine synthase
LDTLADGLLARSRVGDQLDVGTLAETSATLRRRMLRRWLLDAGVRDLTDGHLRGVDALIHDWRGQGGVWLPGHLEVKRARGRLSLEHPESSPQPTTRGD